MSSPRFDAMTFVALFLIFFMGFKLFNQPKTTKALAAVEIQIDTHSQGGANAEAGTSDQDEPTESADNQESSKQDQDSPAVIPPYEEYVITQGVHGYSYGHMAVDLAAGKGATILSPIKGQVTDLYIDEYGNPTIVIENEEFQVTMLHGIYNVQEDQKVKQGEAIGKESNLGYTLDMNGNLCAGRNCGYHTHLNIYDKRIGANVNPLEVMEK